MEGLQIRVTALGHRAAQTANEIQLAKGLIGRAVQDGFQAGLVVFFDAIDIKVQRADIFHHAARKARVPGSGGPVKPARAGFGCLRQQWAQDDSIGTTGNGLGHIRRGGQIIIGQNVHVAATGLIQVVAARGGDICDSGRQRHINTHGFRIGIHAAADNDAGSTRAHQVQRGGVIHHAAGNDGYFQRADELFQVQRLTTGGDVLGRKQGALNKQQLRTGRDDNRRNLTRVLWRYSHRHGHAGITHLRDALR